MHKSILILALVATLAGCKVDVPEQERYWTDASLDPYMAKFGYTISEDRLTISKNGKPLFRKVVKDCYRCVVPNDFYGPGGGVGNEIYDLMVEDELSALEKATADRDADFMLQMGISKPEPESIPDPEAADHFKSVK